MTDETLPRTSEDGRFARVREIHYSEISNEYGAPECRLCREPWPCETIRTIDDPDESTEPVVVLPYRTLTLLHDILAQSLGHAALTTPVPSSPADAGLRDQIIAAVKSEMHSATGPFGVIPRIADAVLAMWPADQTVGLREVEELAELDREGAELVCVDTCGSCDACGMEPFGTPAEGWREAARFLRRTHRDSPDFLGAIRGARLIEAELRRLAAEVSQTEHSCDNCEGIDPGTCVFNPRQAQQPEAAALVGDCVCGATVEWMDVDVANGSGWIHSPGSDTPCLGARPRCPACHMPHEMTPDTTLLCASIRASIAESDCPQVEDRPDCDGCGHAPHAADRCQAFTFNERCECDEPVAEGAQR